ncbi:MAG: transcriptional repressor [Actinobacteria bacterium]|nr:MAG: transcriptional repressor [Actinomycetota bacterium]
MHSPAELATQFRSMGRKLTPQRQLIFSLLHNNQSHPTAESLYGVASAQMPGISLRTVYQTLNELAEMGELLLIDIGEGGTRFDPNIDEHHHAICSDCGKIRDVHVKGASSLKPNDARDFLISEVGVVFKGLCAECEARGSKRSPALQAKMSQKPKSSSK